jgi:hypothetical protein
VRRDRDAVGRRLLGLKDDVAADLVDLFLLPTPAEVLDQIFSLEIAGEPHATASTSSRMRCRRIEAGAVESK